MIGENLKTPLVVISDSDTDEEEMEEEEEEESEEDESSNSYSSDDDDGDNEWGSAEEEEEEYSTDDQQNNDGHSSSHSQYDHIIQLLLRDGHHMEQLKLEECKVYLRKHGLRLTGNKAVCIQRIKEHWRINDGKGEKLYPRSSFSINCTGDVCKGDVVVFTQKVYAKFDKMTRSGSLLGKRTIAGRIVKESYGTDKQQHTFTVEVLWSKGVKKLPPLAPLLVKGRNLYRLKTFRQRWDSEAERSKVLAEKHKRGAAARQLRAEKKRFAENKGSKRKKPYSHTGQSPKRVKNQGGSTTRTEAGKHGGGRGKAPLSKQPRHKKINKHLIERKFLGQSSPLRSAENGVPMLHPYSLNNHLWNHPSDVLSGRHGNREACNTGYSPYHNPCYRVDSSSLNYSVGSASTAIRVEAPRHYSNVVGRPMLRQEFGHTNTGYSPYHNPCYRVDPSSLNYNQSQVFYERQVPPIPLGAGQYSRPASGLQRCSTSGCGNLQDQRCAVFSCWRCCRRVRRRCLAHQN